MLEELEKERLKGILELQRGGSVERKNMQIRFGNGNLGTGICRH